MQRMVENKLVMITGAAGGLGKAFCAACAGKGWDLFITDIDEGRLYTLAGGLRRQYGINVASYACDLANEQDRDMFYEYLQGTGLRFDGLINVAGFDVEGEFARRGVSTIRRMMQLNMLCLAENIHCLLKQRTEGRFMILNVASLAVFQPMPYKALYSATKRFVLQLSLGIREELKPYDVSVTTLCSGGMPTTQECIEAIDVQGVMGTLTTMNVGDVCAYALKSAQKGRAMVIPGVVNRALRTFSSMVPDTFKAHLLRKRWATAHKKRHMLPQQG